MFSNAELKILNQNFKSDKKFLIIGYENTSINKLFNTKNIYFDEFKNNSEKEIISFLENMENKKYDFIIFNFILSDFYRIDIILNLLVEKSEYSIIKFINKKINNRVVKKKRINKIIKYNNIIIFKKFFIKNNFITSSIFMSFLSDYSIYFIKKDYLILAYNFINNRLINKLILKVKNFILSIISK